MYPSEKQNHYNEAPPNYEEDFVHIRRMQEEDEKIKRNIRVLRLVSRILALILSVLVFIPIVMTLIKFLTTKDTFRLAENTEGEIVNRTAWAANSKVWPTYVYFGIAALSLVLNLGIMIAYLRNVKSANTAATIGTVFTWLVMTGNAAIWIAGAVMYRVERGYEGKNEDLWAWTCSEPAMRIQEQFEEVHMRRYCNLQSFSWYAGLAQCAVALLSIVILMYVLRRKESKERVNHYYHQNNQSRFSHN